MARCICVTRRVRDKDKYWGYPTHREYRQEKRPKMVKHLREKIPPKPGVRRQVRE